MIEETSSLFHWNYFLALEADIERLARYVEFTNDNFKTFSIEIALIFLASSSEVDVVAKQLCKGLVDESTASKMNQYRKVIKPALPKLSGSNVLLPRYGLKLTPWDNWENNGSPDWWKDYNDVKHERDTNFRKANLKNVLNSMAGLFILNLYFYKEIIKKKGLPSPSLFTPPDKLAIIADTYGGPVALHFL